VRIPRRNDTGSEQSITFLEIDDQQAGAAPLKLRATASSGLPVRYFVREGPAEVDGDTINFTEIPPRAKFPMKVTIVAWQWGRSIDPKVQSAEPVERTFNIVN
jgi:hypothetical protein